MLTLPCHADQRKQLFDYDQVLNTQRENVYASRRAALLADDLRKKMIQLAEKTADDILEVTQHSVFQIPAEAELQPPLVSDISSKKASHSSCISSLEGIVEVGECSNFVYLSPILCVSPVASFSVLYKCCGDFLTYQPSGKRQSLSMGKQKEKIVRQLHPRVDPAPTGLGTAVNHANSPQLQYKKVQDASQESTMTHWHHGQQIGGSWGYSFASL